MYPIDTIKTRLQSEAGFLASGGFRNIYRGLSSVVIGSAPGAALFFSTYESMKKIVSSHGLDGPMGHMTAASVGEVAACLVRVPTEVLKQRLQTSQYPSLSAAVQGTYASGGISGFFRGFSTTVFREIPFAMIQFPIYEKLCSMYGDAKEKAGNGPIASYESAACGSFAGGVAAAITTPLDVAKTRIMLAEGATESTYATLANIAKSEGISALFAGIKPRVMWISIGGYVFFGVYNAACSIFSKLSDPDD